MRYELKHDLALDRPLLRRVDQMYLGTHFIFRETTLMLLSIAGAVMRKPITFQTPAPLYNGFWRGSVGVPLLAARSADKKCAQRLHPTKHVGYIKLL